MKLLKWYVNKSCHFKCYIQILIIGIILTLSYEDIESWFTLWRPVIEVTGSTLNSVTLLRPWERRFAIISSAWWILTSSKFLEANNNKSIGNKELTTPKRVWINDPMYNASAAFPWMEDKYEDIYLSTYLLKNKDILCTPLNIWIMKPGAHKQLIDRF